MSKREISIKQAEMAGYHSDRARWTRLLVECRVNRTTLNNAWLRGATMKNLGVKCTCFQCSRA
jgi:hypothetical protein